MTKLRNLMLVAVSGGALMALGACGNNEPAATTPAESTAMAPADGAAMAPATDPMVGGAAMSPNETIVANASKASNLTTLVAAGIMFVFGAGPVRGFAWTLTIGVFTSMFSAVMVSQVLLSYWLKSARPKKLPIAE